MTIRLDLGHDLDFEFWRADIEFVISQTKVVRFPWIKKQTYRLNSRPEMWPWVWPWPWLWSLNFKVKCGLDLWTYTWHWPWMFMIKFWNSCISEWECRLTLNKGGGRRSFLTMTVTIWWPKSGVKIKQIETGVISDVSVRSTYLLVSFVYSTSSTTYNKGTQQLQTTNSVNMQWGKQQLKDKTKTVDA